MRLTGSTAIPTPGNPRPRFAEALSLQLQAPTTAALNLYDLPELPEFGRVTGSARYRPYLSGVAFSDIRLEAGDSSRLRAHASGSIGLESRASETGRSAAPA